MSDRLLKITYNGAPGAAKKINAYLRMPSGNLVILRREIEMFLFQERHLPQTEIRTYWIDADSDEIEIVNQNDYDIFLAKCEKNMHMQIAAAVDEKENVKPQATNVDDPSNFIIHDGVECDSCGVLPMIGFRYKCVQCPNFDLCQSCEAAHKHPDHLMVRMPTNNGPGIIDAYFSGPGTNPHCHRRSSRRSRGQCPFAGAAAAAATASAEAAPATEPHKESRRERRHARRGASFMSQIVDAMFNVPQANTTGDATETPAAAAGEKQSSTEGQNKKPEGTELPTKTAPVVEEPVTKANAEEPVAAPRTKEQAKPDETPAAAESSTPTTPVINLESLAQMVHPDYMRAGIEILNNFSEMFAKMIDPNEAAAFGSTDTSMSTQPSTSASAAPKETKTVPETKSVSESSASSLADSIGSQPTAPAAPTPQAVPEPAKKIELVDERPRSDSVDQDWQMIDNTAAPISNVSSTDALINLNATSSTSSATSTSTSTTTSSTSASVAAVPPARDFAQLGEMLRQHVDEEQQQEQERAQSTAHTQTSQVSTVTTSTSTNPVTTNSTSTSTTTDAPAAKPDETHIYHHDERINASVHAMMAMGFSNEGAWLTQLLDSVGGNIPAALDLMHTSQSGRQ